MTDRQHELDTAITGLLGATREPATIADLIEILAAHGLRAHHFEVLESVLLLGERGVVTWDGDLDDHTPIRIDT